MSVMEMITLTCAGSESRPPMLNKENYVPWSSRLLWYAKSRPNGKIIHNSILNGPYVRRMIAEPGDGEQEKVDEKEGNEMGSLKIRTKKMQTPIPTTPRSPRINLSLDNNIFQDLMDTVSLSTPNTSKVQHKQRRISSKDDAFHSQHHDDHQDDDAPLEGEKRVKIQKTSKSSKSTREETIIDEDEVIPKDETPELITEVQNVDKRVPTIFDHTRIEATLNDMLSN
nr:ribonuclease H-like domain-containing protein [Tanacetum cinerariifolium]